MLFLEVFRLDWRIKPYISFAWSETHLNAVQMLMEIDFQRNKN